MPKGTIAISVELSDPARVAGYVNPGSTIAVFVTGTPEQIDEDGNSRVLPDFTQLLFADIPVVGVGSSTVVSSTTTDESGTETTEQIPGTILTLALTQDQAERVIYADKHGELSLGLMNEDSAVSPGPPVTYENLFE
jgi:pilus assembly protein CpaB